MSPEIHRLCLAIVNTAMAHSRASGPCISTEFCGTANSFDVRVRKSGWVQGQVADYYETAFLDYDDAEKKLRKIHRDLRAIIDRLAVSSVEKVDTEEATP